MQKVCKQCNGEYEASRATSRFCGATCRSAYNRSSVTPATLTQDATLKSCNANATPNKESIHATDSATLTSSTQPSPTQRVDSPGIEPGKVVGCTIQDQHGVSHIMQHVANCNTRGVNTCNTGPYKPAAELARGEVNRVSLPGDADYTGVAVL